MLTLGAGAALVGLRQLASKGGRRTGGASWRQRQRQARGLAVRVRCAPSGDNGAWSRREPARVQVDDAETMEETMLRLNAEIEMALECNDVARATRAQHALSNLQLSRPSAACKVLIQQDCRKATAMLQLGESVSIEERIKAAKKLGWWLRWRRMGTKGLVPAALALEGLLWALRSEPEVAWTAQCALYHATRCSDGVAQKVSEGPRGTVTRFLLNEPSPFPLYLPKPTKRAIGTYERALKTEVVTDFLTRLKGMTLVDPGYGEETDVDEVTERLASFSRVLGRSLTSLESLTVLGFEDCAMTHVLSKLAVPKLTSLTIMGACHTAQSQEAILSALHRHAATLETLELKIWTEYLCDAVDPFADIGLMPQLKRLTIRGPPLPVPWEHFAECFPQLEELTFLYSQDFARNASEVLDECDHKDEQQEMLQEHSAWLYRDAVVFARDLHKRGFRRMAKQCKNLKEIRLAVIDSSHGYDVAPAEERLGLRWRRDDNPDVKQFFRRDYKTNNDTRDYLQAQAELLESASECSEDYQWDYDDSDDAEWWSEADEEAELARQEDAYEEAASIAGSAAMLQVVRLFDDPSLEADFGLSPHC